MSVTICSLSSYIVVNKLRSLLSGGDQVHELEVLYKDIKDKLYRYMIKLSGNSHIAEEITQETFCRAFEHILIGKGNLSAAWFYTVAKHLYFDYVKRQSKFDSDEELNLEDETPSSNPDYNILQKSEKNLVRKVLLQLKDNYREILILREFKELSYEEISRLTGLSMEQVKVTIYRARSKFKEMYEKEQ
jgi:RNA polymerase sigma-70 factor, ECF subfamily